MLGTRSVPRSAELGLVGAALPRQLGVAEGEYRPKDHRQQAEPYPESSATSKAFSDRDMNDDPNDKAYYGDEQKEYPPHRLVCDLHQDDEVQDGDEAKPAGLSCFHKDFPGTCNHQNRQTETEYSQASADNIK